jgi:hypothetical protein
MAAGSIKKEQIKRKNKSGKRAENDGSKSPRQNQKTEAIKLRCLICDTRGTGPGAEPVRGAKADGGQMRSMRCGDDATAVRCLQALVIRAEEACQRNRGSGTEMPFRVGGS